MVFIEHGLEKHEHKTKNHHQPETYFVRFSNRNGSQFVDAGTGSVKRARAAAIHCRPATGHT
jgi:hypothetical protein